MGSSHKTGHTDDLNELDFAEIGNEDSWLEADVKEFVEEEEPEVTPEKVVLYGIHNLLYNP